LPACHTQPFSHSWGPSGKPVAIGSFLLSKAVASFGTVHKVLDCIDMWCQSEILALSYTGFHRRPGTKNICRFWLKVGQIEFTPIVQAMCMNGWERVPNSIRSTTPAIHTHSSHLWKVLHCSVDIRVEVVNIFMLSIKCEILCEPQNGWYDSGQTIARAWNDSRCEICSRMSLMTR
jgi:hypothetical protein